MADLTFALLSTPGSPLLGYMIASLNQHGVPVHSILMDGKGMSEKDLLLWQERTKGELPPIDPDQYRDIPIFQFENHNDEQTAAFVRQAGIDVLVNAGTPRILKPRILQAPTIGVANCHPGLLPDFRGCTCVEWAIYLDEQVGNSVHLMTEQIDEGPILMQEGLTFSRTDGYADIRIQVYRHGFTLMGRALAAMQQQETGFWDTDYPREGRYFKVIEPEKMGQVVDKITHGRYAYQV